MKQNPYLFSSELEGRRITYATFTPTRLFLGLDDGKNLLITVAEVDGQKIMVPYTRMGDDQRPKQK